MPDLSLSEKQRLFAKLVGQLLDHIYEVGFEATLGEAWRTPEQAAANAASGKGIANSNHTRRLAIDINLFKDGNYLTDFDSYKQIGDWWTAQHPLARWGGNFTHLKDSDHFSLEHNGIQ
jgi:hypothetical protein